MGAVFCFTHTYSYEERSLLFETKMGLLSTGVRDLFLGFYLLGYYYVPVNAAAFCYCTALYALETCSSDDGEFSVYGRLREAFHIRTGGVVVPAVLSVIRKARPTK